MENLVKQNGSIKPRIIIHGGAGNITRKSMTRDRYNAYQTSLRHILASSAEQLSKPGATALDIATYAVTLLENDELYNSGKGAVFTRAGANELECSIMVSNGHIKRGVGCMMLSHVKNPIKLARELLLRGDDASNPAKDHCEFSGAYVEGLAKEWGLEVVDPSYFFTQARWDEHKKGLEEESKRQKLGLRADELGDWERDNYIPLGTCGAVVLDSFGTICTATSTGGLTNKVPGRIGDTPTLGAGYWAEEWIQEIKQERDQMLYQPISPSPLDQLSRGNVRGLMSDCLPSLSSSAQPSSSQNQTTEKPVFVRHAVGMSGTGNGDTFLRLAAARTVAAKSRFAPTSLSNAVTWMAGRGGELQRSAGERWGNVHEGVGGIIGIELVGNRSAVTFDYNCGGMFRAWIDENGEHKCLIFREDDYDSGPKAWTA